MEKKNAALPFDPVEFFKQAPALMCVLDAENRMLQPNDAWSRVTGHPVAKLDGALVDDYVHPEDGDPTRRSSRISLEAEGAIVQESRFRCADGSYRWIEWTMRVIFDRALVYCCARAVEQPRRATITAARRLETYLRRAPVAMVEVDVERGITEWSAGAERIFGFTRNEVLGKDLINLVVPEEFRDEVCAVSVPLRDSQSGGGRAGIDSHRTKSGEIFRVEWHNAPLVDDEGRVRSILMIGVDCTEIENQRARADESVARFDMLMRGSRSGIWDYKPRDPQNPVDEETPMFTSAGLLRLLGVSPEQAPKNIGECNEYLHPDDRKIIGIEFNKHISERRNESYLEFRLVHTDGSTVWVGATWYALWDDTGGLIRFAGSYTDITERRFAEEDQHEKMALIERQANAIRELQTPILELAHHRRRRQCSRF